MAITRRTLRLLHELRSTVGGLADNAVRDLTRAWLASWGRLEPGWRAAIGDLVGWAQQNRRWPNPVEIARHSSVLQVVSQTGDSLDELVAQATAAMADGATTAITATAAAEPGLIASQLPPDVQDSAATRAGAVILPSALDAITTRTLQAITAQTRPLSSEAQAAMRRELIRSIDVGANPNEAARRMVARVNGAFEGGLVRATVIARTEMLDAHRTASRYADDANADVLDGWTWIATVTGQAALKTCPSCWGMHGTEHPLSQPGPEDHQQGRCSRAPRVKPWSALGIDIPEPDDATPDAEALFDALPEADQVAIMGAERLALLNSGQITWDQLPVQRDNPGWRTSYTPRSVRDLRRLADR